MNIYGSTVIIGRPTPRAAVGALVVAAALWGVATSGTKYALGGFAPFSLLTVELVAATIVIWVAVGIRGDRPRPPWRLAIVLGLLEPALAYVGDTVGLARTSAANAAIIDGLECTFVVLLTTVVRRERMTRSIVAAVALGLLGLAALEHVPALTGPRIGDLYVLGGVVSAAVYTVLAGAIDEECDDLALTAVQFTVATALIVPVTVLAWSSGAEPVPTGVSVRFWVAAVLVGIGGFAVSFLLFNRAIGVVRPRAAAVVVNLIPVFGLVSAVAWLGERLTPARAGGALLIALSVAMFVRTQLRAERAATAAARPPIAAEAKVEATRTGGS